MKIVLILKINNRMNQKQSKAGNWLKAIAAVISFIAGLLTGGNTAIVDNINNVLF